MVGKLFLPPSDVGPDERRLLLDRLRLQPDRAVLSHVDAFEQEFAAAIGVLHAAALSSGTVTQRLRIQVIAAQQMRFNPRYA